MKNWINNKNRLKMQKINCKSRKQIWIWEKIDQIYGEKIVENYRKFCKNTIKMVKKCKISIKKVDYRFVSKRSFSLSRLEKVSILKKISVFSYFYPLNVATQILVLRAEKV